MNNNTCKWNIALHSMHCNTMQYTTLHCTAIQYNVVCNVMKCNAIQKNILFCAEKWTVFWEKVAKKLMGSIHDQGKLNIHAYLIFETLIGLLLLLNALSVFQHVTTSTGTALINQKSRTWKNAPYIFVVSSFTQPPPLPRKLIACVLIIINYSNYLIPFTLSTSGCRHWWWW